MASGEKFRPFVEYHSLRFADLFGPLDSVAYESDGCSLRYPHVRLSMSMDFRDGWIDPFFVPPSQPHKNIWHYHASAFYPQVGLEFDPPSRGAVLNDAHFEDLFSGIDQLAPLFADAKSAETAQRKAARHQKANGR